MCENWVLAGHVHKTHLLVFFRNGQVLLKTGALHVNHMHDTSLFWGRAEVFYCFAGVTPYEKYTIFLGTFSVILIAVVQRRVHPEYRTRSEPRTFQMGGRFAYPSATPHPSFMYLRHTLTRY